MAATRSTTANSSKSGRSGKVTKTASSRKRSSTKPSAAAASRAVRELEIDGTASLGGKKPAPSSYANKVYKSGGAWWQDVAPVSCKPTQKRRRADDTAASDDALFLGEARRQLKRLRTHDSERMQLYLGRLREPTKLQANLEAGSSPDAYVCSAGEARSLLGSNAHINAPVFVAGGSNTANILETDDARRPIEQILDWFVDTDEKHEVYEADGSTTTITTGEIRDRFLHQNGFVDGSQPYNFPDIATPFHSSGMPHFVQTPSCSLLRDVMRYVLDVDSNDICQDGCKGREPINEHRCCKKHFLTTNEFSDLHIGWQHWQGTVMLAEAGALTMPHWDKWGFGTHISCLEGEIGFAWLSHPTKKQLESVLQEPDEAKGKWLYKILRPGDAMYMSPGTPHLVFRLPHGKQTLGLAGHVVRRCDFERWVQLLTLEAAKGEKRDEAFDDVVSGFITGMEHILSSVEGQQGIAEQYGGAKQIAKVKRAIEKLKRLI